MPSQSQGGFLAMLCVAMALGHGCSQKPPGLPVLARVGEVEVTSEEFQKELAWLRESRRPIASKEALLEEIILRKALVAKAVAAGLDKDPGVRRNHETQLMGMVRAKELDPLVQAVTVAPAEVEARYRKDQARHTTPAKVRLALLHLQASSMLSPEKESELRARLVEARAQAVTMPSAAAGFGALAVECSDDQASRYRGGDVGWFDEGEGSRWPEAVMKAGFALKDGEVSEVLKTPAGLFLVRRTDSRPARTAALPEVQEAIRRRLLTEKRLQVESNYLSTVRRSIAVETHAEVLAAIPFEPATGGAAQAQPEPPSLPKNN